jgi:hypothetical protein
VDHGQAFPELRESRQRGIFADLSVGLLWFPVGNRAWPSMRLYFEDEDFDGQLQRSIGKADSGMANVGECLTIASRVTPGDRQSWYQAWAAFGPGLKERADIALDAGHVVSARSAYLRAAEYFRQGVLFSPPRSGRGGTACGLPRQRAGFPGCAAVVQSSGHGLAGWTDSAGISRAPCRRWRAGNLRAARVRSAGRRGPGLSRLLSSRRSTRAFRTDPVMRWPGT